jgi:beta-galactosidase GanA
VDNSPVYEAFKTYPDTHRVGWDGWCGHLIRDLDSMGGKKENTVICLESSHIREAVERYIEREWKQWLKNPNLLYNIMAYELQYICYCERSQQMFRAWLEKKHGKVERLNKLWGTSYRAFGEIAAPPTKNARPLPGTNRAQWYDWACFNQDRFSDYLAWVKSVIRRFDPVTPLAAGGSYSMLYGGNGTSGIDEEQIINRVGDIIIHEGSGSTLGMDLQLALSETPKPLCDPEMNLENVRYLLPHMLHGKSVIQIWHWPDQPPREYPHLINDSPAHGWKFPLSDVAALLRAALDGRRLSREIASFSAVPAQVAILYSRTSMLQIPPEMLTWRTTPYLRELENAYEASRFLDTRTTFVTEKQILEGRLSRFKILLVPAASHMRAEVVASIYRFVEQGGVLLLLPSSFVSDEYNRPVDYLSDLGIKVRRIEQVIADRTGELEQGYDQTYHERVVYRSLQLQRLNIRAAGLFAKNKLDLQAEGTRQDISISTTHEVLATFSNDQPALISLNRGRGHVYYAATSFPRRSLSLMLDRLFDASGVSRPVRVRGEHGELLWNVEARFAEGAAEKLIYIVNFTDNPVNARVEMVLGPARGFFDLRKQERLAGDLVRLLAGETLILRLD